jgi:hypothetical protein
MIDMIDMFDKTGVKPSCTVNAPPFSAFFLHPFPLSVPPDGFAGHFLIYFLPIAAGLSTLMGLPPA